MSVAETLKQAGRGSVRGARGRVRQALVVAQVSLSVALLIGTALMVETILRLNQVDPGFRSDHVLTARTSLPDSEHYRELKNRVAFYREVLARVQKLPGVTAAGYTTFLPLTNRGGTSGFEIEGRPKQAPGESNDANHRVVTPDYLRAIGVPLTEGRMITEADGPNEPPVALVNRTMARQYWAGESPLGKRFRPGADTTPWVKIVGVVGDVKQMGLDVPARAEMYFSYQQPAASYGYFSPRDLAVRTAGDPVSVAAAVRRAVAEVDKDQPVSRVQPLGDLVESEVAGRRVQTVVLGSFTMLALALASLGIYAVLAYTVTQRSGEIGLRMALGAREREVLAAVMGEGARLVACGMMLGLAAAWVLTRWMASLLYGVTATDARTFAGSVILFLAIGLSACYFPARRAARIDPATALRQE